MGGEKRSLLPHGLGMRPTTDNTYEMNTFCLYQTVLPKPSTMTVPVLRTVTIVGEWPDDIASDYSLLNPIGNEPTTGDCKVNKAMQ